MENRGWIALDIDGTITLDKYSVPKEVIAFLKQLYQKGWNIALATGRPFAFASMALKEFDFPYAFFAQNGSLSIELPEKKIIERSYIQPSYISLIEKSFEGIDSDFVIYAGYEKGDFCYWRPDRLSQEELGYLEDLQKRQQENWRPCSSYEGLEPFPLVKCFGTKEQMEKIRQRLLATEKFHLANIKDPFVENYYILLVTDKNASKGKAVFRYIKNRSHQGPIIAAGDDTNDESLLEIADVKIAMDHAPDSLKKMAHLIAPPTKEMGIISALQKGVEQCSKKS